MALTVEKEFPTLIGRLVTTAKDGKTIPGGPFPTLIGRLVTTIPGGPRASRSWFPTLIGRLVTFTEEEAATATPGFQPS